tara:strand:- start:40 stop:297 length:258 start_codon:yes stop_codon:yes gene_type:complete
MWETLDIYYHYAWGLVNGIWYYWLPSFIGAYWYWCFILLVGIYIGKGCIQGTISSKEKLPENIGILIIAFLFAILIALIRIGNKL